MDFFKIKNNTSNSIIINGTYIAGNSEMILSEEVVSNIDSKYFTAELLINLGKSEIEETYVMINNKNSLFYKKPPSGIPKTHLDREVNLSLKKADNSIQKGKIKVDDFDSTLMEMIQNIQSNKIVETNSFSDSIISNSSVVIKEKQLEKIVRDALQEGRDAYQVLQEKIGYDQLTSEVQYILDVANENIRIAWKDPVTIFEFLPLVDNTNGDVRLVLTENSFYRWNSSENSWKKIGVSGDSSTNPEIPDGAVATPIIRTRLILGEFFADEGQQIFKLQDSYIVGSDDLQVLLNGILLIRDEDYIEVDNRTIQMIFPLEAEDYVVFSVSHSDLVPYVVVEKHVVFQSKQRVIMLNKAVGNNASILQVFLNGVAVSLGEDKDYLIYDQKYIKFNYDLEDGDIVIARFETSSLADNFELQFAQMQRVYMNIAKQIQDLRERVEDKF